MLFVVFTDSMESEDATKDWHACQWGKTNNHSGRLSPYIYNRLSKIVDNRRSNNDLVIHCRDIKASGIYFVLYELMSGDTKDIISPLSAIRIIFAGGLAG